MTNFDNFFRVLWRKTCSAFQGHELLRSRKIAFTNRPDFYTVVEPVTAWKSANRAQEMMGSRLGDWKARLVSTADIVIIKLVLEPGTVIYAPGLHAKGLDSIGIKPGDMWGDLNDAKCRATDAKVVSIKTLFRSSPVRYAKSSYSSDFIYEVGQTVTPQLEEFSYEEKRCRSGIHFFFNENQAKLWGRRF